MYSLKVTFIMITIGVFIVFDDTYAKRDFTGCINYLIKKGFYSTDDGIANYVNLFSMFVDKYHRAIERFDSLILSNISNKVPEEDIDSNKVPEEDIVSKESEEDKINFLDQLYMRQMVPEIIKIQMDNADTWCTSHADEIAKSNTEDGGPEESSPVESCKEELKSRGFIYTHGITNYAFLNKQPSLLTYFTADLGNAPTTSDDWCKIYSTNDSMNGYSAEAKKKFEDSYKDDKEVFRQTLFDGILKVHGYNRTAEENYAFLMTKTRFIDQYKEYIVETTKGMIVSDLIVGSSKWCLERCLDEMLKREASNARKVCEDLIKKPFVAYTDFTLVV